MRKRDKKQKKNLIFSAAVVALGCIISAAYANRTLYDSKEYKVDLSELDVEQQDGLNVSKKQEKSNGAVEDLQKAKSSQGQEGILQSASGTDVVDQFPLTNSSSKKDGTKLQAEADTDKKDENEDAKENASSVATDENEEDNKKIQEKGEEGKSTASVLVQSLSFEPNDKMTWPVEGNVILNYSMDSDVYFETLEQYRYNPAIYIGAKEGSAVSACAKGAVSEIGKDARLGQYLVLDLGNGYQATYGQLQNLQVKEGAYVVRGQVLGDVAKTTRYFSVEGDHLYLKITKDGEPVDPMSLFE